MRRIPFPWQRDTPWAVAPGHCTARNIHYREPSRPSAHACCIVEVFLGKKVVFGLIWIKELGSQKAIINTIFGLV
jgi:hypothetical protein